MKLVIAVLVVACIAAGLALWIGYRNQQLATGRLVASLSRSPDRKGPTSQTRGFDQIDSLPEPVARYLRHALRDVKRPIRTARLRQSGELRTDVQSERWMSFRAEHISAPLSTGFVWDARIAIAPLAHVRVRDAYVNGQGSGRVALLSALTIAAETGDEMDSGALHRYLAEAVWYPTALLPSPSLKWTPIDGSTALATLTDAGTTVSLEFRFNDIGEVTSVYTPARWGHFNGDYRQVPWEARVQNYVESESILVPSRGEVGWYSSGEWQCVWRGDVTEIRFEFAL